MINEGSAPMVIKQSNLTRGLGLRVLVTGIGGPAGRALAAQLKRLKIETFGVDMAPIDLPGVQTFQVPPASDGRMLKVLQGIIREHAIDVVLPTVSDELVAISAIRDECDAQVVIADQHPVWLANDKLFTMVRLASRGVSIPRFGLPEDFGGCEAALHELGAPMIVKPRVSRGGRGVVVVNDSAQVQWEALTDTHIVQEFAPGQEFAPVVFGTGGPIEDALVVVLEKTGLAAGNVGNATGVRRTPAGKHRDVAALARAAVEALDLRGPVDIDIRRLADGRPVVLEVNARFGANSQSAPELLQRVLASVTEGSGDTVAAGNAVAT